MKTQAVVSVGLLFLTGLGSAQTREFKEAKFSLIHAQCEGIEETLPLPMELRQSLDTLFGYTKYRIIGEVRSPLHENKTVHFEPNSAFSLKVVRIGGTRAADCLYEFTVLQEKKSLVKGMYIPKAEVPLIIRGPFYDKGNLILVVRSTFE